VIEFVSCRIPRVILQGGTRSFSLRYNKKDMFNIFGKTTEQQFEHIYCEKLEEILNQPDGKDHFEVIDVRTPGEYHSGHIPDARLLNLMDPSFKMKASELDPEKTYYVYCRSGSRSMTACRVMAEAGLKKLFNVKFGLMGWQGDLV